MAFCPECGREFPPEVVLCRACQAELVEELPAPPRATAVRWETLCPVGGLVEGQMLKGALESQGLHPRLISFDLPAYAGVRWDWSQRHWGEVRVPAEEVLEARAVLGDFLRAVGSIEVEGEEEGPETAGGAAQAP